MTINKQRGYLAIVCGSLFLTAPVADAFTYAPLVSSRSATSPGRGVAEIAMTRSSGESSSNNGTPRGEPKAFGWIKPGRAQRLGTTKQQGKEDWSKLFATPEPEAVSRIRPLVALGRGVAGIAQESLYASPLFLCFSALLLISTSSAALGARAMSAWGVGRLAFALSMKGEDVSRRMPVGFVCYASLFLVLGSLAFMNGLKAVLKLGLF